MDHGGVRLPDIIVIILTGAAAAAVMWSPYDLWFPVVLAAIPALWLLIRYLVMHHELKTGNPGIAKIVGTDRQQRRTQMRGQPDVEYTLYAPIVEYETPSQKMRITYPVYTPQKWFEEGQSWPIHYSVRHPWLFWFIARKKERLMRLGLLLTIAGCTAIIYAICLSIAYLLA